MQPAILQGNVLYIIQGEEWQIATGIIFPHPLSRCHSPHKSSPVYSSGIKLYLLLSLASTFAAIFLQRRCNCSALPSENPLLKKSKSSTWNKIFFEIPKITHIFQIMKTNFSEQRCRSPPVLLRHKNHKHSIRHLTRIQSKTSPEGTNNHGFNDTKIYSAVVAGPNKTTNKGHTHTRSKTETDEAPLESTWKTKNDCFR